jgi:hypothetical protein
LPVLTRAGSRPVDSRSGFFRLPLVPIASELYPGDVMNA